jgi:hypothetical protein
MSTVSDYFTFDIQPILLDLIVQSEQWEEVSIQLLPPKLQYLCGAKGRLPLLKKLKLCAQVDKHDLRMGLTLPSVVANIFEDAPLLTHVILLDAPTWQFKFNWSSLTILNFHRSSNIIATGILPILRKAINLVELTVMMRPGDQEHLDSKGGRLIHLPHLEHLSINRVTFLSNFDTPSLWQLKIRFLCSQPDSRNGEGIIAAFLRRLGIKLGTLVIEYAPAAIVNEVLQFTTQVDNLVLHECHGRNS